MAYAVGPFNSYIREKLYKGCTELATHNFIKIIWATTHYQIWSFLNFSL